MIKSKMLKNDSSIFSEKLATGRKVIKKKPILYPIPPEDSFIPLQEDSEEIKYKTRNNKS